MILLLLLWTMGIVFVWFHHRRVTYLGNVVINSPQQMSVDLSHNHKDSQTIQTLDTLRMRAQRLVDLMYHEYPNDERVTRLHRWNGRIDEMEHIHLDKGVFGYNRNKGESISICVHDKKNRYNSMNEMFFVVMHEMSHIMCANYEHDNEFWHSFKDLIQVAMDHGLYEYVDYNVDPVAFCDGYIHKTPLTIEKK